MIRPCRIHYKPKGNREVLEFYIRQLSLLRRDITEGEMTKAEICVSLDGIISTMASEKEIFLPCAHTSDITVLRGIIERVKGIDFSISYKGLTWPDAKRKIKELLLDIDKNNIYERGK